MDKSIPRYPIGLVSLVPKAFEIAIETSTS